MKCLRPTKFNEGGQHLSCGQCMPCRITRRTEWLTKLELESRAWNQSIFVTLTYNPENLPDSKYFDGGSLKKDHLQLFLKRFRRNYQYKYGKREIRYFGVGEYGDKSHRAHYHLIIFNVDLLSSEAIVAKSWKLGHTQTTESNTHRFRYTLGYTIKKMTNMKDFPDGRLPEFNLMSRQPALGTYALPEIYKRLKKRGLSVDTHLSGLEKHFLENDYHLDPDRLIWNGWFKIGKRNAKLDRPLMVKLSKMFYDKYDYLAQTIDATHKLIPTRYRHHNDLLHDISLNATIKFRNGDEHETVSKQAEKVKRNHSTQRTL